MTSRATAAFIDLLFILLIVFVLLPHNPTVQADADPPGEICVYIHWPPERDVDVDLWVRAPGETPVGYSNLGGQTFNLRRDDLGHYSDQSKLNKEEACTRGVPNGEYIVNLHLYSLKDGGGSVPVIVEVAEQDSDGMMQTRFSGERTLERSGQEVTVVRFDVVEGSYVAGSESDLPIDLRARRSRYE